MGRCKPRGAASYAAVLEACKDGLPEARIHGAAIRHCRAVAGCLR